MSSNLKYVGRSMSEKPPSTDVDNLYENFEAVNPTTRKSSVGSNIDLKCKKPKPAPKPTPKPSPGLSPTANPKRPVIHMPPSPKPNGMLQEELSAKLGRGGPPLWHKVDEEQIYEEAMPVKTSAVRRIEADTIYSEPEPVHPDRLPTSEMADLWPAGKKLAKQKEEDLYEDPTPVSSKFRLTQTEKIIEESLYEEASVVVRNNLPQDEKRQLPALPSGRKPDLHSENIYCEAHPVDPVKLPPSEKSPKLPERDKKTPYKKTDSEGNSDDDDGECSYYNILQLKQSLHTSRSSWFTKANSLQAKQKLEQKAHRLSKSSYRINWERFCSYGSVSIS